jgi:hypothetical protein
MSILLDGLRDAIGGGAISAEHGIILTPGKVIDLRE